MGDAFPDRRRIELLEKIAEKTGLERTILGSSGSDAVEAALKTARLASGRSGVLAFEGGYHGLSYGALAATGYKRDAFQAPFAEQLGGHVRHAPFGASLAHLDWHGVGAVLVEPIQGRGGVRVPPSGWLGELVDTAHRNGARVIFDEIYTGFGRTGAWLRAHTEGVQPDLVCLGKGLAGGFPISACVGTAETMDAWGASKGEALHTQTFLGNPVGSAMGLACIEILEGVVPGVHVRGQALRDRLEARGFGVQGAGMLLGVRLGEVSTLAVSRSLLRAGYIVLPAGEQAEVLALTPPLTISDAQLDGFVEALDAACRI
jgi:acetylornithine/succinyldiaminopimelate/putrescine aminotransferase